MCIRDRVSTQSTWEQKMCGLIGGLILTIYCIFDFLYLQQEGTDFWDHIVNNIWKESPLIRVFFFFLMLLFGAEMVCLGVIGIYSCCSKKLSRNAENLHDHAD
eukprot:TRINITY_DN6228_c0_g1_i1.p1 TRINITY_DN6228_c0_g1~~TRINITY_DN6228_c0_g1_i1.p1  ORF type:complete len:103 (-),score=15.06 TRINITY_DN6228_c0_g1_i1:90-398(-)